MKKTFATMATRALAVAEVAKLLAKSNADYFGTRELWEEAVKGYGVGLQAIIARRAHRLVREVGDGSRHVRVVVHPHVDHRDWSVKPWVRLEWTGCGCQVEFSGPLVDAAAVDLLLERFARVVAASRKG